jgi:predicted lipoprotein
MPDQETPLPSAPMPPQPPRYAPTKKKNERWLKPLIVVVAVAVVLTAMLLNTKFISAQDIENITGKQFSAKEYAEANFEKIAATVVEKAQPATTLIETIKADQSGKDDAGELYGGRDSVGAAWAFPISLTGVAGKVNEGSGQLPVTVEGFPEKPQLLIQTGPAMIGSALRDVTGEITFGLFLNQTEYQNVGQELNDQVRSGILKDVKASDWEGKTITVTGAFLLDAQSKTKWLIMPVKIQVEG